LSIKRTPSSAPLFPFTTLVRYTALVRSLFGLAFSTYFKGTRLGLWLYSKFDRSVDYLVERFGWTWLEQPEDAWRKKYPHVTKKIDELEARLQNLEEKV